VLRAILTIGSGGGQLEIISDESLKFGHKKACINAGF
jgi:hypothetical protein